ncbi:MAG: sigma factor-like helix-turn-helix DNA-binding protein, partial [Bacteroidia bacterium]|nr:sigma factor-like helix-turn-helix DNA-binding protein [Bacteroidia bacterium]
SKLKKEMDLKIHASSFMETDTNWHLKSHEAKEEELSALELAVEELNEEQRRCIRLFYLQEKSYQEVSQLTGYTMNEVKSFIQNGKRNLKLKLEKNSEREF